MGYGDYLEQLTYLLFLKLADEFSKPPYNRPLLIPKACNRESLTLKRGGELESHYGVLLRGSLFFSSAVVSDLHTRNTPQKDEAESQAFR